LGLKDYTDKISEIHKSLPCRQACKSVIQTSYDIVKAHGGEIKVKTNDGQGAIFSIQLPA
jgi:hypothetical protein